MTKIKKIDDASLSEALMNIFRYHGYEGATLSLLAEKTGLQKASLYHRFPNGKEQMACHVLSVAQEHFVAETEKILQTTQTAFQALDAYLSLLRKLYLNGKAPCLLNKLNYENMPDTTAQHLLQGLLSMQEIFSRICLMAGLEATISHQRSEHALVTLQGALVVSHGMNDPDIFDRALNSINKTLLS